MQKTTLSQWLDYIATLHTSRIDLGLQRIVSIAKEQCLNSFSCPVITVAGTNGKGSCVRFLESIYSAAGYRVGAYFSPHLRRFNERIRIQEKEVDDQTLVAAFERVESFRKNRPLSFFEFTTLAALFIFKSIEPDVVVLEVGLGGRLDAVNMVESDAAIVASISLDHLDWLGDNRESIGYEKAGVYRANKPAICGDPNPPHRLVEYANHIGAKFFGINKDFFYQSDVDSWSWGSENTQYQRLPIPILKCQNAASSLMAVECLQDRLKVSEGAIKKGLKEATLAGRFEFFSKPVKGVFDVAHNPDSARCLAEQLEKIQFPAKKMAVIGMLKDKDIPGTIEPLLSHIDAWFVAGLEVDRAANPKDIVAHLKASGVKNYYDFETVSEAFKQAVRVCSHSEDRIIVFGSFHTVAAVQEVLADFS